MARSTLDTSSGQAGQLLLGPQISPPRAARAPHPHRPTSEHTGSTAGAGWGEVSPPSPSLGEQDSEHARMQVCRHAALEPRPAARPLPTPTTQHPCFQGQLGPHEQMTGECSCQHLRAARGRVGRAAGGPEQAGGQTLPHPREQTGHRERKRAGSQGAHGAKVGPSTVPFPVCPKPGLYVGGGSRGPRAFRCVWCARTTGSPAHTGQSRLPRAGSGWRAAPSLA